MKEQNPNKKILIATPLYPPDIGGPATYVQILKNELTKIDINVTVLSFGEVRHLPKVISHFVYFVKLIKKARGMDIILALDPISVGLPVCIVSFLLRKKFILRVAGDRAWEAYQSKSKKFVSPEDFQKKNYGVMTLLRRLVQKSVAKRAERIIVPSNYLKSIVTMWGIEEKKIHVVYNGFDDGDIILGDKKELRSFLNIEGKIIMSAGRLVSWKGFNVLIEIMPDIIKNISNAKLYIAGDGPDRKKLELKVKKLGLGESVQFLGGLPRATLLQYFKASDVFALNTGYEGLSHQLIETMSVGTPIVTTNVGGNPELIENGKEGILISYNNKAELENAVMEILNGHVDSSRLVENAKKRVSEFSRERMVEETTKVLDLS